MARKIQVDPDRLRAEWESGAPLREIGARLGIQPALVSAKALAMGLPSRQISSGELPQAAICSLYASGESSPKIGKRFGVSHRQITRILKSRWVVVVRKKPLRFLAECVRLYRAGLVHEEIAERLGLSMRQVGYRVRSVLGAAKPGDNHRRRRGKTRRTPWPGAENERCAGRVARP